MTPHVIELAPRLMPIQVDEGGGAVLERLVTELGRSRPHRRRSTAGDRRERRWARRVALSDGSDDRRGAAGLLRRHPPAGQARPRLPASRSGPRGGVDHRPVGCVTSDPYDLRRRRSRRGRGRLLRTRRPRLLAGRGRRRPAARRRGRVPGRGPVDQAQAARRRRGQLRRRARTHRGRARGRAQRRGEGHLRQARRLRRRPDPARRRLRRGREPYSTLRPLVGSRTARRTPPRSSRPAGAELGADACPTMRRSVLQQRHQGRDLRARSRRRLRPRASSRSARIAGTSCGGCVPHGQEAA